METIHHLMFECRNPDVVRARETHLLKQAAVSDKDLVLFVEAVKEPCHSGGRRNGPSAHQEAELSSADPQVADYDARHGHGPSAAPIPPMNHPLPNGDTRDEIDSDSPLAANLDNVSDCE